MALSTLNFEMKCKLQLPENTVLYQHIKSNAHQVTSVVTGDSRHGKRVAICGAGVSLRTVADQIPADVDEVWACNSALTYLQQHGHRVTHGFAIDQGEAMLEEWRETYDVTYLVASSVHPSLVDHLKAAGRECVFFHSFLGLPDPASWTSPDGEISYEMLLYTTLYPTSVQAGYGLNSVPRAICVAIAMGFDEILVYGADCACAPDQPPMPQLGTPEYEAWILALPMYADGRTAGEAYSAEEAMAEAVIDGRRWHTRPDMVISAGMMVDLIRQYPQVRMLGDTLPNALVEKDAAWMEGMPRLTGPGDVRNFGAHATQPLMLEIA